MNKVWLFILKKNGGKTTPAEGSGKRKLKSVFTSCE